MKTRFFFMVATLSSFKLQKITKVLNNLRVILGLLEAFNIGLVDELVNPASILTTAERRIRKYMGMERNTSEQSKLSIRKDLIASTSADQSEALAIMLKQWWAPTTRNILKTVIDNLQKK